ncbi:MAG TPA: YbhB/YbcL family Raf kinase inhibitor-like protein, partial [Verrucomicrobiae bacterium]|nr:YbhB/YbcL family Raf kinase inhibitor-like protein [Verrucomicrobiae bacterium]
MKLVSSAFDDGAMIPSEYTCDGSDRVPPLMIEGAPAGTVSFAIIVHDPDSPSGNFDHWVAYDIPADTRSIDSQVGTQGMNSWPRSGYGGPCPGSGTHRYIFTLYALDTLLNLAPDATRSQVEQKMSGHILAQAELMG